MVKQKTLEELNIHLQAESLTAKTAPAAQDHIPATKQTGYLTTPYQ
jgi:hypothetical protein